MNQTHQWQVSERYVDVLKVKNSEIYSVATIYHERIFYVLRDELIKRCITNDSDDEYILDYAKLPGVDADMKFHECIILCDDDPLYKTIEINFEYRMDVKTNYIYRI